MTIWVVAADASRARIFTTADPKGALAESEDLVHPETRLRDLEINADKPGRSFDSAGQGRHAMGTHHDPREQERVRFAQEICQRLAAARKDGSCAKLYLVAAPRVLGLVREYLDEPTRKIVAGEIHKDLTGHTVEELRSYLPERL